MTKAGRESQIHEVDGVKQESDYRDEMIHIERNDQLIIPLDDDVGGQMRVIRDEDIKR